VSEAVLPLIMAPLTIAGILAGYRVAMVLAGAAAIFILVSDLPTAFFSILVSRIYANVFGTLAILIPPSVMLIVLGDQLKMPVPDMFAGAIGPGLLLVGVYAAYIIWKARKLPAINRTRSISITHLLFDLGPLLALVVCVLGSIIGIVENRANAVGRERVIASTDCGFATFAGPNNPVAPTVVWSKLRALSEGAARASDALWG